MGHVIWNGHIKNWVWRTRSKRREVRENATREALSAYLDSRYAPVIKSFVEEEDETAPHREEEQIFSIWFQKEENAPEIVKACFRSVRANCSIKQTVLDKDTLFDYIQLPDYVVDKWRSGKMGVAHFSDICRVELLYRYGGVWLDATDFVPAEFPQWLLDSDFFVYLAGDRINPYSFMQNCFIRSKKGNFLLKAWRAAMLAYWKEEDKALDYFVHQMLFKKVVENNTKAAEIFAEMPKLAQDPTHELWFGGYVDKPFDPALFQDVTSKAIFQKTEYRSANATSPTPGSFAAEMMRMY